MGAVFQTLDDPFFVECNEGIKEVVASHARADSMDSQWNDRNQDEIVSRLLNQGVSALFLNPVNWESAKGRLLEARQVAVPCVVVDAPVKEPGLVLCQVASDDVAAGRLAARCFAEGNTIGQDRDPARSSQQGLH